MQDLSPHPWAVLWFASQCCPVRTHLSIPLYLFSISFLSHLVSSHLYSKVPCNLLKCRENRDRKPRTAQQPASGNSQKCHSGQEHCPLGPACPTSSTPTHEEEKKKEPMRPEHESPAIMNWKAQTDHQKYSLPQKWASANRQSYSHLEVHIQTQTLGEHLRFSINTNVTNCDITM